jgi:hypothetical protein
MICPSCQLSQRLPKIVLAREGKSAGSACADGSRERAFDDKKHPERSDMQELNSNQARVSLRSLGYACCIGGHGEARLR